jgi:3-hydroxyisobutyrate dehydrogenase-like beta-hydroxyacid dehydrogenase
MAGIEMPVGAVVRAAFAQAIAEGAGHRDWAAVAEVTREP